jgi:hypothetical protein
VRVDLGLPLRSNSELAFFFHGDGGGGRGECFVLLRLLSPNSDSRVGNAATGTALGVRDVMCARSLKGLEGLLGFLDQPAFAQLFRNPQVQHPASLQASRLSLGCLRAGHAAPVRGLEVCPAMESSVRPRAAGCRSKPEPPAAQGLASDRHRASQQPCAGGGRLDRRAPLLQPGVARFRGNSPSPAWSSCARCKLPHGGCEDHTAPPCMCR